MAVLHELQYLKDTVTKRHLSEDDVRFLCDLQKEMNTQDAVDQADPRFWAIKGSHRVYGVAPDDCDGMQLWHQGTMVAETLPEAAEFLNSNAFKEVADNAPYQIISARCSSGESLEIEYIDECDDERYKETLLDMEDLTEWLNDNIPDEREWHVWYTEPYGVKSLIYPDTFFLTKSAAQEHLKKNAHYYSEDAHAFAMTARRSPEVEKLYEILHTVDFKNLITSEGNIRKTTSVPMGDVRE